MVRSIVLCLALLPAVAALVQQSYPASISISPPRAAPLRLRGGLGDIDPNLVAKGALGISGLNGALMSLAPAKCGEMYGVEGVTPFSEWLIESQGNLFITLALLAFLTVTGKTSLTHAFGWCTVPIIIGHVKTLLNDTPKKLGFDAGGQYFNLFLNCALCYSMFNFETATCINVMKGWAVWLTIMGVWLAVSAETCAKAWGCHSLAEMDLVLLNNMGFYLLGGAVHIFFLAQGESAAKAFGYSIAPFALNLVNNQFISKTNQKFGVTLGSQLFWLAYFIAVAAGTLM